MNPFPFLDWLMIDSGRGKKSLSLLLRQPESKPTITKETHIHLSGSQNKMNRHEHETEVCRIAGKMESRVVRWGGHSNRKMTTTHAFTPWPSGWITVNLLGSDCSVTNLPGCPWEKPLNLSKPEFPHLHSRCRYKNNYRGWRGGSGCKLLAMQVQG